MSSNNDFKPGLEGVVAVETEIAEPDREGGSLRYRGVDIEQLVGRYPYENVWGLLVDDDLDSKMPDPEPYEPATPDRQRAGRPAGRDRTPGGRVEARQAQRDLGRAGARGSRPPVVADDGHRRALGTTRRRADRPGSRTTSSHRGRRAAEKFLLQWRGEADPRHVKAIDTYWICTAEHGLNASTFTARVVASTGADCGAALSSAVGALLRPAARRCAGVRQADARGGRSAPAIPEKWVREALESGKRIMGFGHRVYRAEDPRSRILKRTAKELGAPNVEIAEELESGGARSAAGEVARSGRSRRTSSTTPRSCSTSPRSRRRSSPAMFACSRVGRLVGAHPRAEANGSPLPSVGPLCRTGRAQSQLS